MQPIFMPVMKWRFFAPCGLYWSACYRVIPVLGLAAPIVFLSMHTQVGKQVEEAVEVSATVQGGETPAAAAEDVNPMHATGAEHPAALRLAKSETAHAQAKTTLPEAVKYQ